MSLFGGNLYGGQLFAGALFGPSIAEVIHGGGRYTRPDAPRIVLTIDETLRVIIMAAIQCGMLRR